MSVAFFDVDGTLLPHPSLERRFFWNLTRRGKIPAANYLRWGLATFRQAWPDFANVTRSNKLYLRGISVAVLSEAAPRELRRWVPEFFPRAIQRIWWHSLRGDTIVLITGTLAPLAEIVKSALERELLCRGVEAEIPVVATELSSRDGCWTGCVDGAPLFAEAKAAAVRKFANARRISLSQCYAYGDHLLDRAMLETVGKAFAVNPSRGLRRIARRHGWPVLNWSRRRQRNAAARHALEWKGEVAR